MELLPFTICIPSGCEARFQGRVRETSILPMARVRRYPSIIPASAAMALMVNISAAVFRRISLFCQPSVCISPTCQRCSSCLPMMSQPAKNMVKTSATMLSRSAAAPLIFAKPCIISPMESVEEMIAPGSRLLILSCSCCASVPGRSFAASRLTDSASIPAKALASFMLI